ncbi:unnamed protein product [Rhizoctonia solani]|uniref:Protein kinase domain-containing protein n=1 Tax=Rhizoctonia solani TaxID=456999 RepID=A0A8H3DTE9_9AGAM|nr:unnamed protein product [Rhizoctonia solani]
MSNTPSTELICPYVLGATFGIEVTSPQGTPIVAEAKVVHVYAPFTMSSVMRITLTPQSTDTTLPGEAILKVYDRRFADGIRKMSSVAPPTSEGEIRYAEYLCAGNVAQTEHQVDEIADQLPEDALEHIELSEQFISILVKGFFKNETITYRALSNLQGKYIPTFYGTTRFLDESSPGLDIAVPGVLVEFIPGTDLSLVDPTTIDVDTVCSTAVDIVNLYSNLNVLNSDVRLENFIVKPNGSEIVMIDFGHCRLRREDEDDQSWGKAKANANEEGCVGWDMHDIFNWNYVESERYYMYFS